MSLQRATCGARKRSCGWRDAARRRPRARLPRGWDGVHECYDRRFPQRTRQQNIDHVQTTTISGCPSGSPWSPCRAATCAGAPTQGIVGPSDAKLIFPGTPEKSVVSLRMHAAGHERMPPVGVALTDPLGPAPREAQRRHRVNAPIPLDHVYAGKRHEWEEQEDEPVNGIVTLAAVRPLQRSTGRLHGPTPVPLMRKTALGLIAMAPA